MGNHNLNTGQTQPVTSQTASPPDPNYRESGLVRWSKTVFLLPGDAYLAQRRPIIERFRTTVSEHSNFQFPVSLTYANALYFDPNGIGHTVRPLLSVFSTSSVIALAKTLKAIEREGIVPLTAP